MFPFENLILRKLVVKGGVQFHLQTILTTQMNTQVVDQFPLQKKKKTIFHSFPQIIMIFKNISVPSITRRQFDLSEEVAQHEIQDD